MAEENRMLAAGAYALGIIFIWTFPLAAFLPLIILAVAKKDDHFARFHVINASLLLISTVVIFTTGMLIGLAVMLGSTYLNLATLGGTLWFAIVGVVALVELAVALAYLWSMYKAFVGEKYSTPIVSGLANKYA